MNNIKNAFKEITPDETKKKKVLNAIINSKKEKIRLHVIPNIFATALVCAVFIAVLSFNKNDIVKPINIRTNEDQIIFEGICYETIGIWEGDINSLVFVKETNEYIMGNIIYKLKNSDLLIIKNSDNYIKLSKCGGE